MIDRFVCFDVEMPNGDGNRVSAIGITVFENGEVTERIYSLINPETWFQPYVVDLIGITPEMVEGKPTFAEYWDCIKDVLSSGIVVGHGVGNDLKALSCCLKHYKIDWLKEIKYICTVEACCKIYPDKHAYSLNTLCEEFGIDLIHHNALSDSEACGRLLLKCFEEGFDEKNYVRTFDLLKGHNKTVNAKKPSSVKKEKAEAAAREVREDLFALSTEKCKSNTLQHHPMFDEENVIGISQAALYTYHKKNAEEEKLHLFTKKLPHDYHEENNLHAIIISDLKLYSQTIKQVEEFLPYINNIETCELLRPKIFAKKQKELNRKLRDWLYSDEKYTLIFALNILKKHYMRSQHLNTFFEIVASVRMGDEEVETAVKKFYAEALAKSTKRTIQFLNKGKVDDILEEIVDLALKREGLKNENREMINKKLKIKKAVTV